jgi:hypothetical protein
VDINGVNHGIFSMALDNKVKAVIEYNYPQDEDRLKHALKGQDYFEALLAIEDLLYEKTSNTVSKKEIRIIINSVLKE